MINLNYRINRKYESSQLTLGEMLKRWKSLGVCLINERVEVFINGDKDLASHEKNIFEESRIDSVDDLEVLKKYFDKKVRTVESYLLAGQNYLKIDLIK